MGRSLRADCFWRLTSAVVGLSERPSAHPHPVHSPLSHKATSISHELAIESHHPNSIGAIFRLFVGHSNHLLRRTSAQKKVPARIVAEPCPISRHFQLLSSLPRSQDEVRKVHPQSADFWLGRILPRLQVSQKIINSLEKGRLADAALFATGIRPEDSATGQSAVSPQPQILPNIEGSDELQIHKAPSSSNWNESSKRSTTFTSKGG